MYVCSCSIWLDVFIRLFLTHFWCNHQQVLHLLTSWSTFFLREWKTWEVSDLSVYVCICKWRPDIFPNTFCLKHGLLDIQEYELIAQYDSWTLFEFWVYVVFTCSPANDDFPCVQVILINQIYTWSCSNLCLDRSLSLLKKTK